MWRCPQRDEVVTRKPRGEPSKPRRDARDRVVDAEHDLNREDRAERTLRRRVLDNAGLPYVFVEFDGDWRLPGDLHPNAATARKISVAIADELRGALRSN
ncbi:MAG TPA: hypothetical protein VFR51_06955 [Pyrinomonadaceae bacterium]|nr:hypothetical protein [Pyrinomonadaceae bacterium]